jgi:hypothetical protein
MGKKDKKKKGKKKGRKEREEEGTGTGTGREEEEREEEERGDWPSLELVEEVELAALLGDALEGRHEASGVHHVDGRLYVVFDDVPHVARIDAARWRAGRGRGRGAEPVVFLQRGAGGFEDLTFDPRERRWYLLVESAAQRGVWRPRLEEYTEDLRFVRASWLDWEVEDENKGLEGLSFLRLDGQDCILGLCEGNWGRGGRKGREAGHGRLQLFTRGRRDWERVRELELPSAARFEDYSSLDIRGDEVTVASQATSAVWLGRVTSLEGRSPFADAGRVYRFPADRAGRARYGSVEGVTWVGERELVAVSDHHEGGGPGVTRALHRFRVPE